MHSTRPHYTTRLHFGFLLRWILAASFLAASGLSYLYLKHRLYDGGLRKKVLERELEELSSKNRDLDWQIASLTSRVALQQRLKDGYIKMVDIPDNAIIHLRLLPEGNAKRFVTNGSEKINPTEQIRTVAHERPDGWHPSH